MTPQRALMAAALAITVIPAPYVFAQATGLDDLIGARAGQAENELGRRGWTNTGGTKSDDRSYANWWNDDRRQCVTIATMDGRYVSISATTAPDCRQSASAKSVPTRQWRNDTSREAGFTAPGELPRYCKGEAAAAFDRKPADITTNLPIRRNDGSTVSGWFEGDRGTKFFTCRFDADGRFISVY